MKLLKWLLQACLTAFLVSMLTIMTTGIVVNAYIQLVLASLNIQLETPSLGVGGMMKAMLGGGVTEEKAPEGANPVAGADPGSQNMAKGDTSQKPDGSSEPNPSSPEGSIGAGSGSSEDTTGQEPPDDSLPVMGESVTETEETAEDEPVVMTPGDIVDRKDNLPREDKEQIFTLLMDKLPQSEMQKISEAMEGGLTEAELEEIEQGISQYLSEDEYDRLISLLQE